MTTLRFEDASAVTRLDLEGGISKVMADFHLGDEALDFARLSQGGVGEIQVATTPKIVDMLVPLYLKGTWSQIKAFHASLVTELHRETNILRYIPPTQSDAYLIDTFHTWAPTLFRPSDLVSASASGAVRLDIIIPRASQLRGAAQFI